MKHQNQGVLFANQVHESLTSNIKITGLTIDSLVLLLKEHLSFISTGFFVQLEQEEQSFGVYGSCLEHCDQSFLYYPETKGKGFVQGFEADSIRFQKEAIIKLSTSVPYCCIGSEKSLNERSVEKRAEKTTTTFSVGDILDIGLVSEFLFDVGYKKSEIANEPGVYSLRGDVLDVFPYHFKNPFRVSFEFDKIENISLYNPNTQISIKPIKTLKLDDFKSLSKDIDNISIIKHSFFDRVYIVSCFDGVYSISNKNAKKSLDLAFRAIDVYGKTHTEKAKEIERFSETIHKKIFIGGQTQKGVSHFKKGFFLDAVVGSISRCVASESTSTLFVSENEINSKRKTSDRWAPIQEDKRVVIDRNSISNINHGDFVVHRDFGIGVYLGVRERNGKEVVSIEYQDAALVYVSLDQVNLVHKYIGAGKRQRFQDWGLRGGGLRLREPRKPQKILP